MTDPHNTPRARLITRWIGTGIGGALLITVLSLTFARSCVTSAQSHVLAVVLALGAAILLWGIVGGLQIDVKLKFKALGEVTAAGVAGIFLVVHFVSADGIIASDGCGQPQELAAADNVLRGRVHEAGKVTQGIQGATVKIELPDGIIDRITDDEGQFDRSIDADVEHVKLWVIKDGYKDSAVVDVDLPLEEPKVVIQLSKTGAADAPTGVDREPLPTDVERSPRLPTDPKLPTDPVTVETKPRIESGIRINSGTSPTADGTKTTTTDDKQSALKLLR